MKRITDPSFRYTSSAATDIRKTFRRVRREQAIATRVAASAPKAVVTQLKPKGM